MALEHQKKLPTASAHKSPSADGDVMSGCWGELLLFYRHRTELSTPQIKTLLSPTPARRRPHGLRGRPPTPAPVAQIYVAAAPGNPPSMRVTRSLPPTAFTCTSPPPREFCNRLNRIGEEGGARYLFFSSHDACQQHALLVIPLLLADEHKRDSAALARNYSLSGFAAD